METPKWIDKAVYDENKHYMELQEKIWFTQCFYDMAKEQPDMKKTNVIEDLYVPSWKHLSNKSFKEVQAHLLNGGIAYLPEIGNTCVVFTQVPSIVPYQFIAKMSSLPQAVKMLIEYRKDISGSEKSISYENQWASFDLSTNTITYYTPTISDLNSKEWVLMYPEETTVTNTALSTVPKEETIGVAIVKEAKPFPDHVVRVIEEYNELYSKIEKLTTFVNNPKFEEISGKEQAELLKEQLQVMTKYYNILHKRLINFGYIKIENYKD